MKYKYVLVCLTSAPPYPFTTFGPFTPYGAPVVAVDDTSVVSSGAAWRHLRLFQRIVLSPPPPHPASVARMSRNDNNFSRAVGINNSVFNVVTLLSARLLLTAT